MAWKAFSGFFSQHLAWFSAPLLRRVWPYISPLVEKEFKWILTYIKLSMTCLLKTVSICSLMKKMATDTTGDQTKTVFLQLKNTTEGRWVSLKTNTISKVSVEQDMEPRAGKGCVLSFLKRYRDRDNLVQTLAKWRPLRFWCQDGTPSVGLQRQRLWTIQYCQVHPLQLEDNIFLIDW